MSGYRASSYDPEAGMRWGPPLRPFNKWQRLGVALTLFGAAVDLIYVGGYFGWISPLLDRPTGAGLLILAGIALMHSRRQPIVDTAPELAAARHRSLLITLGVCVLVIGAATVIEFTGA